MFYIFNKRLDKAEEQLCVPNDVHFIYLLIALRVLMVSYV